MTVTKRYPPADTATTIDAYERAGRETLKLYEVSSVIEGRPCQKYTAADVERWGIPVLQRDGGHVRVSLRAFKRFLEGAA